MKTLILRTDRLGDFYSTIPYINSITRVYGKKNVDVVVNKHIYSHIKKKSFLCNKFYSFPEKGIFEKIFLILKLRKHKYKQLIIFDGKDRSIILSKFLNINKVYHTYPKKKLNHLANFLFTKKYITLVDDQITPLKNLYKSLLYSIGIKIIEKDNKILIHKDIKKINFFKNKNIKKKYILLHVDEKWFSEFYIKRFSTISPDINKFYFFLSRLVKIKKMNLIITTGTIKLPFIKKLSDKYFILHKKGYNYLKVGKLNIILLKKISIDNLEIITMNADKVISCHGPLTLICGSFGIPIIDIIDKKQKKWYFRHTSHIKNYQKIYREGFNELSKKIILKIKT